MLTPFSQFESAFRAMLAHKADGRDHDAQAELLMLRRPRGFPESDWLNAIHVLGYGARGHPGAVFRFIEMALHRYSVTRLIALDDAHPQRIYSNGVDFDATHLDRLVRVDGRLYRTTASHDSGWEWIDLVPVAAGVFSRPDFTASKVTYARFLPFRVREATGGPVLSGDPGTYDSMTGTSSGTGVKLEVLLQPTLFNGVPPTYLRGVAEARTTDPLGGHLCANAEYSGRPTGSAYPLYLDNGRRMREFEDVLEDVCASAVQVEVKVDGDLW